MPHPRRLALLCALALAASAPAARAGERPAKDLFGSVGAPSEGAPRVYGSYAKGCLAGGTSLPAAGPGWQTMRPSRDRAWGHPALVGWLRRFAADAEAGGWPGLLVGDLAQPRGGPMRTGHASHQIGLDADLWLTPAPRRQLTFAERETMGAASMIAPGTRRVDPAVFGPRQVALVRTAARSPEVARVFVHPGIKAALCAAPGTDRAWLAKVRPWWGHDSHFHVRLACPAGEAFCRDQDAPPAGDGCGPELAWWLSDEPWVAKGPPAPPRAPLALAELPAPCRTVLDAAPGR